MGGGRIRGLVEEKIIKQRNRKQKKVEEKVEKKEF